MSKDIKKMETDWEERLALFIRYLAGDAATTRTLFISLSTVLEGYFHARMGGSSDAEDLLQATLLKIHFARDRFDVQQSLKTWVFTIASRTLIDHWRGNQSSQNEPLFEETEGDSVGQLLFSDLLNPEQKTQLHGDLNKALATLKPIDRSIVYLYGVEGLSMAEIAEVHSLSEGAVKLRAHRAYQNLRKILGALLLILFWRNV
jgi:RNA polymerase sigma-70 factor, ECF subfamily